MQPRLDRARGARYTPAHPAEQVQRMSDETPEARIAALEAQVAELRDLVLSAEQERERTAQKVAEKWSAMMKEGIVEHLSRSYEQGLVDRAAELAGAPPEALGPLHPLVLHVADLHKKLAELVERFERAAGEGQRIAEEQERAAQEFDAYIADLDRRVTTALLLPEYMQETFHQLMQPMMAQADKVLVKIQDQVDVLNTTLRHVRFARQRNDNPQTDESAQIDIGISLRELLKIYDENQKRHPQLTLADFARLHNLNYRSLVTERNRQRPPPSRVSRQRTKKKPAE